MQFAFNGTVPDVLESFASGLRAALLERGYEELDEWALRSHQRAVAAIDSGRMAEEIVAVEVPERGGPALIDTDEAPRRDTTLERLAALPPLDHAHPTHTAGNSPSPKR